jgi:L-alanine-DL-glutamate epimerase-like enolase superfamily enzyme
MKITRIRLYRQFQPFRDGPYTCSGDRTALGFASAVVAIETDKGITGWGEMAVREAELGKPILETAA